MSLIMTPDHPDFYSILQSRLPPDVNSRRAANFHTYYAAREDSGILEPMDRDQVEEYLYGGEYDRVEEKNACSSTY